MSGERFDYGSERQRHENFVGREALLARLDDLLVADGLDRWVVVTGGPGMGKSAILSAWLARREAAGAVVPHHFIRRRAYDWDDPAQIVGSLVAQIDERFPAAREPDSGVRMHAAARLARALSRVSERELGARQRRLVVLIDGLDEYDPPAGTLPGDSLAAFLPHALPRGVSFVCASRPRHPYLSSLAARDGAFVQLDLDAADSAADNDATVRKLWERAAGPLGLDARFVEEAVARAGGNVQHAVQLQRHVADVPPHMRRVEEIPRGLAALIEQTWERIAGDAAVVEGLGILCAAREALTLDELAGVASWSGDTARRAFLRGAKEVLIETQRPGGQPEYRLHHDSIRAHIAQTIGDAALRGHHLGLAQWLARWPAPYRAVARQYALRHALIHRAEAGDWAGAWWIASDTSFLEAKCRELGAHEMEADVARVTEACRSGGDAAIGGRFIDLTRALSRESHWLHAAPEATPAVVWNRLRRSGWSEHDLRKQLRVPAETAFLRVRHIATRESPALIRDLVGHTGWVKACAVTPDGRRVVSASRDRTLRVWEIESGRTLVTLKGHLSWVNACAVTPDGQRVVSASGDGTLKVWDLESGLAVATMKSHAHGVNACAVTPDGQRVVSASGDGTLKMWELRTGRALATLEDRATEMLVCAVTPDGRRLVSASEDKTLRVWNLESGQALVTLKGHAGRVNACAVTPDSRRVVSASEDKTLRLWDLRDGGALGVLVGHGDEVTACAVTPDGRRVVSASRDHTLKVWDLEGWNARIAPEGHADRVRACAVTPDGRHVVSASEDTTLKVWDIESGRAFAMLVGHAGRVRACATTPDGRRVISVSNDRTLKVWDLNSGCLLATLEGHAGVATACAVAPDGRRVVSASWDGTLKVWDLASGRALVTLEGHNNGVTACAVTPDGQRVVSASRDGTLRVWDLASGRAVATLKGHDGGVTACAVTSDGQRVVSASEDRTLRVWDLRGERALATLSGHAGPVTACAVTQDDRHVVSASADKTLKVWNLATGACLLTHRGDAPYTAVGVASGSAGVVAGDVAGGTWFLDWPAPQTAVAAATRPAGAVAGDAAADAAQREVRPAPGACSSRPTLKHTILFLPADPTRMSHFEIIGAMRAIQLELEHGGRLECFELRAQWGAELRDLLGKLRNANPAVVHFSGHHNLLKGVTGATGRVPHQEPVGDRPAGNGSHRGLLLEGPDGRAQAITAPALHDMFGAAGSSVKLVVLSACYSDTQVEALLAHVDCVVAVGDLAGDGASKFAVGFYGGLDAHDSVAGAFRRGCAAIGMDDVPELHRPQLRIRNGVDASKLVLGFPVGHLDVHDTERMGAPWPADRHTTTGSTSPIASVDIGILTIRDDEFRAVLDAFPQKAGTGVYQGARRQYILRHADVATGERYTVAILRQVEEGTGEAQHAARDLIDDLAPKLMLVVGIAGGLPSDDVTLGDVVLGTRIHDYTVEAVSSGQAATYAATGGPIDQAIAAAVAMLAGREDELGDWTAALPSQPAMAWTKAGQAYGPPEWQRELRVKLAHHHGGSAPRRPIYASGPIASSDRLVKDPTVLFPWITTARNLLAIEMESGGVYRAARERCPMLPIRGISDIVGLPRADAWAKFACAAAAAFTRAFLRTRPVSVGAPAGATDPR